MSLYGNTYFQYFKKKKSTLKNGSVFSLLINEYKAFTSFKENSKINLFTYCL